MSRIHSKGGPKTSEDKARATETIKKAASARQMRGGIFSEEMRDRLRPIVLNSAVLLEKILTGNPVTDDSDKPPTPADIINAFKAVAPYVMTELKPVMDETLCRIVADVLAEDERIPFDVIGDVVANLIERLNESPGPGTSKSGNPR